MAAMIAIISLLVLAALSPVQAHYGVVGGVNYNSIIKACPSTPLQYCDFYFSVYKYKIPDFLLKNVKKDYTVSPNKLRYSVKDAYKGIAYDDLAEVDNTGKEIYFSGPPIVSQFYLNGWPGSVLKARVFNSKFSNFKNRCIVLPIRYSQVTVDGKTINLSPGDKNTLFPEARRCVVFKTH